MRRSDRHNNKKRKIRINPLRFAAVLILLLLVLAIFYGIRSCSARSGKIDNPELHTTSGEDPESPDPDPDPEPYCPPDVVLTVRCAGDVMGHLSQLYSAYDKETDSYDFNSWFRYVTPLFSEADIAMVNIETTFKGAPPYTGYPSFNTPDSLADALKAAGVNLACFANNHMLDGGAANLKRSVQMFRDKGFKTAGFRFSEDEPRYTVIEMRGISVAVLNYTYETPRNGGRRTIQSEVLSDEMLALTNHFGYEELDADLAGIKEEMRLAREDGADVIICFLHWGEEYQRRSNMWQERIAACLAENGADIIFGSHPHVLQNVECIEVQDEGRVKMVPVCYSLGNFISNQRQETLSNRYTEQGMIADVRLRYSFKEERITELEFDCIPTWVDRYKPGGNYSYAIIPLLQGFEENETLVASGHAGRAKQALEDIKALIGEEYIWQ